MKHLRHFPLFAFFFLSPLYAWGAIPDVEVASLPLFPPTNSHHPPSPALERTAVQALLQLTPEIAQDANSRRAVAIALARLGASDAALKLTRDNSVQNEVRQMAARRSIFSGTLTNARYWISKVPVTSRADLQLQLARRLLLEKQPQKTLEILRSIPLRTIDSIEAHGDIAVAFAEAGSKVEAQKRFELLERALKKLDLATHEEGTKQLIASDMARLAFLRLRASLPLPAHQVVTEGEQSLIYVLSFYLDAKQESPIREILELLPPTNALDLLSGELLLAFNPANDLRHKLAREWLSKIPADKRTVYVGIEVRELTGRNKPIEALKLIEEFLPPNARRKAERHVRWLGVLGVTKVPPELRKQWATQLLRELQIQRQQQLKKRTPDEEDSDNAIALYGTLTMIVEVALVLEQNQTAQSALYEIEKLYRDILADGEDEQAKAIVEQLSYDWERAGNTKRAALWQQKMKPKSTKAGVGALAQFRELISRNRTEEAMALLPRISTKEWGGINDKDFDYILWRSRDSLGVAQKQLPNWTRNLATAAQKVAVLSQWASSLAPWEGMRWARVGEKMS